MNREVRSQNPKSRSRHFTACCLLTSGFCLLSACTSAPAPKPLPIPLSQAQLTAGTAAKLSDNQNWTAAAREWQRAADRYALLNDLGNQAVALHNLAQAQRELGNANVARDLLEQAAALNLEQGNIDAWWRDQIALLQIESRMVEVSLSETRMEKMMAAPHSEISSGTHALFLNELGLWQSKHDQPDKALKSFGDAETLFFRSHDTAGVAAALSNRARVHEGQRNFTEALKDWKDALALFEQLADARGIAYALAGQGRSMCEARWNLPAAEKLLRRAVDNFQLLKLYDERAATLRTLEQCIVAQKEKGELIETPKPAKQPPPRRPKSKQ